MPWRALSELEGFVHLHAGSHAIRAQTGPGAENSVTAPAGRDAALGAGAPAATTRAPGSVAAPPSKCRSLGCDRDAAPGDWTGRCASHADTFRDRLREMTDDIGRGTLEP